MTDNFEGFSDIISSPCVPYAYNVVCVVCGMMIVSVGRREGDKTKM